MGAPFGKYKNAADLRKDAEAYFAWCDANPIRGSRTNRNDNGEVVKTDVLLPRPYTFEGLALHCKIADWQAFANDNKKREGFADVLGFIRNTIRRNQIEGAMVGAYKENITARLNGIAENMNTSDKPAINLRNDEIE